MHRTGPAGRPFWLLASISITLWSVQAAAGLRYPRIARDAQGTWIATDEALIQVVGELWTFYGAADGLPADRVRMVAPDDREVWAATPRGLGRMDRSSRRWEAITAPDPLPSNDVHAVAVDDRYAWVGTARGAVVYDKMRRDWSRVTASGGPGAQPVYDVRSFGRSVWLATARGAYRLDRKTRTWRHFGPEEGFSLGAAYEMIQSGESLWFLCRRGLVRFDLRTGAVSVFGRREGLPSPHLTAFAPVQGEIWIGTRAGMVVYSPGADAIGPFIYDKGMPEGIVTGIEVSLPWVWVGTTRGLGRFNTLRRVWEEKKTEDGLASTRIEGLALAGSTLVLLQPRAFQAYLTQQDDWVLYPVVDVWAGRTGSRAEPSAWRANLELQLSGEGSFTRDDDGWSRGGQLVPDLRLGAGTALDAGRTLDASVRLDAGDVTTSGVRAYDAEIRLRGGPDDSIRELLVSDELPLRGREDQHDLLDDAWLEGIGIYQGIGAREGRARAPVEVEAEAGYRRGVRHREFFRGSIENSYQLAKGYITPGSDLVKVDGMILERGVDYIITHTTGQLTFLNPDRVNALSLVEITYTYEQIPRKQTAGGSILEMLPWDNELGGFTRSGTPVYVTDEGGLYLQIDGAAPKYIDRGWVESVFQDYAQGATGVSVQIHDMGTPEQAREVFDYDRPVSYQVLWEEHDSIALLDESLPSGYAVKMWLERYYVELSIDEKSRSAEILITLFAQAVRTKGDLAGTLRDSLRPLVGRLHMGISPDDRFGVGGGFLASSDVSDPGLERRLGLSPESYDLATVDLWTDHRLGSGRYGGRLQSFFQAGSGHARSAGRARDGRGAAGNVIYNSEALNLRLDGEAHARRLATLANRDTPLGTLAGDVRGDATFMPVRWLSLRMLYDHQRSYLAPELGEGTGINENLLGKLTFMKDRWPTVWLLGGRSLLSGGGHRDEKLRLAGSLEYDLAHGVLDFLEMRKLTVKAYFDHSENQVARPEGFTLPERWGQLGSAPGTAQNLRLETKAAPTATEDGYVRFERKTFEPAGEAAAGAQQPLEAWELVMGAASRYVPGVVPTFNGKLSRYQGRDPAGNEVDQAQALLSGQVELFPGRWIEALGATMLAAGYGFTNTEEAGGTPGRTLDMNVHLQKHQVEGRLALGRYDDPLRLETRGKWWVVEQQPGPDPAAPRFEETERYLEVLNRLTWRPVYVSPITLRFDASELSRLVEDTRGSLQRFLPSVEWERRWSHDLITKIRLEAPLRLLDRVHDENLGFFVSYKEVGIRPWAEVRLRLREVIWQSLLRFTLRASFAWIDWFERDTGAERAIEIAEALWIDWERAGSFIFRLGLIHTWHACRERVDVPCASFHTLQPSIKAIARF